MQKSVNEINNLLSIRRRRRKTEKKGDKYFGIEY